MLTPAVTDKAYKKGKKVANNKSKDAGNAIPDELKGKTYPELLEMANEGRADDKKFKGNTSKADLIIAIMSAKDAE